jgi:hypothetical protein
MLTDFEVALMTNKKRTEPFKNKADTINKCAIELFSAINLKKGRLLNKDKIVRVKMDEVLNSDLVRYINLIDTIFPTDTIIQPLVHSLISYNNSRHAEWNLWQINMMESKIKNISNLVFKTLYKKIGMGSMKLNKNILAIIPKEKYLYPNEVYQAKLELFKIDSTHEFLIDFGKEILKSNRGMAEYVDSNTLYPGLKNKRAVVYIESPATGEILTFPFYLKYQIADK